MTESQTCGEIINATSEYRVVLLYLFWITTFSNEYFFKNK